MDEETPQTEAFDRNAFLESLSDEQLQSMQQRLDAEAAREARKGLIEEMRPLKENVDKAKALVDVFLAGSPEAAELEAAKVTVKELSTTVTALLEGAQGKALQDGLNAAKAAVDEFKKAHPGIKGVGGGGTGTRAKGVTGMGVEIQPLASNPDTDEWTYFKNLNKAYIHINPEMKHSIGANQMDSVFKKFSYRGRFVDAQDTEE